MTLAPSLEAAPPAAPSAPAPPPAPRSGRLVFLDALRGFDMFWIIGAEPIVQGFGKTHQNWFTTLLAEQLVHVKWVGFHFEDLIFPLFLCIVGVSLVLSLDRLVAERGVAAAMWRVIRRSALLYLLGVFYYGGVSKNWPDVQVCGVLPRIAVCYLAAGLIYCCTQSPKIIAGLAAAFLLGYWALLAWVPFPNLILDKKHVEAVADQIGSNSPQAIAAAVSERVRGLYEEERNLANYVDFLYLPGRKAQLYYVNEGLLSILPSIALPLFGALAGLFLKRDWGTPTRKALWLMAAGGAGVVIGSLWGLEMPVIKRIWSSSFCVIAAGWALVLMGLFYYLVDVCGWRRWCAPFVWIGCNPITLYLLGSVFSFGLLASRFVGGDVYDFFDHAVGAGVGNIVHSLVALTLIVLLARFLYRRQIFIRV